VHALSADSALQPPLHADARHVSRLRSPLPPPPPRAPPAHPSPAANAGAARRRRGRSPRGSCGHAPPPAAAGVGASVGAAPASATPRAPFVVALDVRGAAAPDVLAPAARRARPAFRRRKAAGSARHPMRGGGAALSVAGFLPRWPRAARLFRRRWLGVCRA
jgi:hypothetical protein